MCCEFQFRTVLCRPWQPSWQWCGSRVVSVWLQSAGRWLVSPVTWFLHLAMVLWHSSSTNDVKQLTLTSAEHMYVIVACSFFLLLNLHFLLPPWNVFLLRGTISYRIDHNVIKCHESCEVALNQVLSFEESLLVFLVVYVFFSGYVQHTKLDTNQLFGFFA